MLMLVLIYDIDGADVSTGINVDNSTVIGIVITTDINADLQH